MDLNSFESADAIICSAYKFFGPHIGVMAFKGHRFNKLKPNKVGYRFQPSCQDILDCGPFPNEENCEISRWEMGTLNYEGLAGFEACTDYLASLSNLETVIRMRHDNIVVIFQKCAIISHNPAGKSAFNYFDSYFQSVWSIMTGSS